MLAYGSLNQSTNILVINFFCLLPTQLNLIFFCDKNHILFIFILILNDLDIYFKSIMYKIKKSIITFMIGVDFIKIRSKI